MKVKAKYEKGKILVPREIKSKETPINMQYEKGKIFLASKDLPHETFYLTLTHHKEMFKKENIYKNY